MAEAMSHVQKALVGGVTRGGVAKEYSSGSKTSISDTIADGLADILHALVVDVSQIKACFIVSDQAITLEFNNSTTGVPTIVLVAGVPYVWDTDSYFTDLLATNITALYVTNASGALATFSLDFIIDPTV